jgi:hypothetical protein
MQNFVFFVFQLLNLPLLHHWHPNFFFFLFPAYMKEVAPV